jgi:hypothetical protein
MCKDVSSLWDGFSNLSLRLKWNAFGVLVSAFVVGYGIGVWYQNFHVKRLELKLAEQCSSYPAIPHRQALIISPEDHSYVGRQINVSGSYSDVGGRAIWVLIYSNRLKRYFPARTVAKTTGASTWVVEDLQIGTEDDSESTDYDIAVFLVEPDSEGLANYIKTPDAEGFVTPFKGMYEQDRVRVTRRETDD